MFFQQIDTVVSFALVMLLLSLLITAFVQLWVSVLGLRGRNLVWAVERLLKEAAPELADKDNPGVARELSRQLLGHEAMAVSTNWLLKGLDWLLEKVRGKPGPFNEGKRPPTAVNRQDIMLALESLLASGELLTVIDKKFPQQKEALKKVVEGKLAQLDQLEGRISKWFDLVMSSASEKFKLWSRWLTVAGAVLLAFFFQVDAVDLLSQLAADPEVRAELLARAPEAQELFEQLQQPVDGAVSKERVEALEGTLGSIRSELESSRLEVLQPYAGWSDFKSNFLTRSCEHLSGLLMTILLLSLGAPFWYSVLNNLLKFRSIVRQSEPKNGNP